MNADIKPSWLRMNLNKLQILLRKRNYPDAVVRNIIHTVVDQRKVLRSKRIKNKVAYRLWDELLTPARAELNILRVMRSKLNKNGPASQDREKLSALQEYEAVISSTVYKLRKVQADGEYTPHQFVSFIYKETGRTIPNNGEHWSDYVSTKDRTRVHELFSKLPDPPRGRRKNPFERRVAPVVHERVRAELVRRMNDETERLEQELNMTKDTFERERLEGLLNQVYRAQSKLDALPLNIALPTTWHGLLDMV